MILLIDDVLPVYFLHNGVCCPLQEIEAAKKNEDWISVAIKSMKKASPISLKITLRSL